MGGWHCRLNVVLPVLGALRRWGGGRGQGAGRTISRACAVVIWSELEDAVAGGAHAASLNVDDIAASSAFLVEHFGFREDMAADGFASLTRDDAGLNVAFLRRGLPTLPADQRDDHAGGLILAFVVEDLDGELARLKDEGVRITMPLTDEEWGERAFQVRDPNGVIVQLVDWHAPTNS